jgi:hypothetical protein
MLVAPSGDVRTFEPSALKSDLTSVPPWIALEGCVIVLGGKVSEELENFIQSAFIVGLPNVKNPENLNGTSSFPIEIFSSWDDAENKGIGLVAETSSASIP